MKIDIRNLFLSTTGDMDKKLRYNSTSSDGNIGVFIMSMLFDNLLVDGNELEISEAIITYTDFSKTVRDEKTGIDSIWTSGEYIFPIESKFYKKLRIEKDEFWSQTKNSNLFKFMRIKSEIMFKNKKTKKCFKYDRSSYPNFVQDKIIPIVFIISENKYKEKRIISLFKKNCFCENVCNNEFCLKFKNVIIIKHNTNNKEKLIDDFDNLLKELILNEQ